MEKRNDMELDIAYSALLVEPYMYGNEYMYKDKEKAKFLIDFITKSIYPSDIYCNESLIMSKKCEAVKIMYKEKDKSIADKAAKEYNCIEVYNKYN